MRQNSNFKEVLTESAVYWKSAVYQRTGEYTPELMQIILDLEYFGDDRADWRTALDAFVSSVERDLFLALSKDDLPDETRKDVVLIETIDAMLRDISAREARTDWDPKRFQLVYKMAWLIDKTVGQLGLLAGAVRESSSARRTVMAPLSTPVAFHWNGRYEQEWDHDASASSTLCGCDYCSTRPQY